MSESTCASFWIGNGDNRMAFSRLLEYRIAEDGLGDFVPCAFCKVIGVQHYDDDFFGGHFLPKRVQRLDLLFPGELMLPQLKQRWPQPPPPNCGVALYGYAVESPNEFQIDGFSFEFLGAFMTV